MSFSVHFTVINHAYEGVPSQRNVAFTYQFKPRHDTVIMIMMTTRQLPNRLVKFKVLHAYWALYIFIWNKIVHVSRVRDHTAVIYLCVVRTTCYLVRNLKINCIESFVILNFRMAFLPTCDWDIFTVGKLSIWSFCAGGGPLPSNWFSS